MSAGQSMPSQDNKHVGVNLDHGNAEHHRLDEETVFGFWVFLMSDAVLFALLFATYASMTTRTAGGPSGHDLFELGGVFAETMALLFSTLTFGLASAALKARQQRQVLGWLALTGVLGLMFIGLEYQELSGLIAQGAGPQRSGFLSAFFVLLATHGVHVLAGVVWLAVMMVQICVFGLEAPVRLRLLRLGLFWHFLDIVWVAIFSIVYLAGIAT
ncbi:MAG: cytochrome o ubiquinol oxidase, subunit [Devosia sp.]|nr:cytochrome o ubiquinol oxidase, subunit [Devosia sp.]